VFALLIQEIILFRIVGFAPAQPLISALSEPQAFIGFLKEFEEEILF